MGIALKAADSLPTGHTGGKGQRPAETENCTRQRPSEMFFLSSRFHEIHRAMPGFQLGFYSLIVARSIAAASLPSYDASRVTKIFNFLQKNLASVQISRNLTTAN